MKTLIITLCIVMLTAGSALAGKHGKNGHGPMGFFKKLTELDLSVDQKKDVAALMKENRPDFAAGMKDAETDREALRAALEADTFDEAKIRAAASKIASHRENRMVDRARFMSQLKKILTPEQWEQLRPDEKNHQDRKNKMKERMSTFQQKVDEWISANS